MVVDLPTVDVIKVLVGEDFLARAVKTDEYFINCLLYTSDAADD